MSKLITEPNLTGHDDLYQDIIEMHQGLARDVQDKANAKLILLLSNHIGDPDVVREAIAIASKDVGAKKDPKK